MSAPPSIGSSASSSGGHLEALGEQLAFTLEEAAERLRIASEMESETEAMLLLAQKESEALKKEQAELTAENTRLRKLVAQKRVNKRSEKTAGHFSDMYDWVCEITKLTEVTSEGWPVRYSEHFMQTMSEADRLRVLGPKKEVIESPEDDGREMDARSDLGSEDGRSEASAGGSASGGGGGGMGDGSSAAAHARKLRGQEGWDGAVVAVLGLFDKGKTFVLNHLAEANLPSGKKVGPSSSSVVVVVVRRRRRTSSSSVVKRRVRRRRHRRRRRRRLSFLTGPPP